MNIYDLKKQLIIKQVYRWDLTDTDDLIELAKLSILIDNFLAFNNALELKDKLNEN
jgi:hypothetical protein